MSDLKWPSKLIRRRYLDFFREHSHTVVSDPRLLFSPSSPDCYFLEDLLGKGKSDGEPKRLCGTQMCIRTDDIEHVDGIYCNIETNTSFEWLVNCSMGDCFKEEAIQWAWDVLIKVYMLCGDHIYATYFGGDEMARLPPDNETKDIWLKLLPPARVLPFGCQDNFWKMGETGVCGPRTQIYYDRIGRPDAASLVNNKAEKTCIEIWNLLFVQFNRDSEDSLKHLPTNYVVSRTELETLASVLQLKWSSYDTDIFLPLYEEIHKVTGIRSYDGNMSNVTEAYRVVADHIRTLSLAIANGTHPGGDYAIRRIFYRMVRHGMLFLQAEEGFFSGLVKNVVNVMGDDVLKEHEKTITQILQQEESSFCRIMQLVIGLSDVDRRENALIELTKDAQLFTDLAPTLWFTRGAFTFLLTEFKSVSPESLTSTESKRLCKLLRLMKCVAAHPDTRALFIKAAVHMHIYPYIHVRGTNEPTAIVQKRCLEVLLALVRDGDPDVIGGLLKTDILPLCVCFMSHPSTFKDARETSMHIIEKVLMTEVGLDHGTKDVEQFYGLVNGLAAIVDSHFQQPQLQSVKIAIRCYSRLSIRTKACEELVWCLPHSLQDNKIDAQLGRDENTRQSLKGLLKNVGAAYESLEKSRAANQVQENR